MRKHISRLKLFIQMIPFRLKWKMKDFIKWVSPYEKRYAVQWAHKTNERYFHVPLDKNYVFTDPITAQAHANSGNRYSSHTEHWVVSRKLLKPHCVEMLADIKSALRSILSQRDQLNMSL